MNIESLRIAWACFLGAFVGAFLALKVSPSHPYMMWVGIGAGGLIGYMSYSIRQIIQAAKMVWSKMPEKPQVLKALFVSGKFFIKFIKLGGFACLWMVPVTFLVVSMLFAASSAVTTSMLVFAFPLGHTMVDGRLLTIYPQITHPYMYFIGGTVWMILMSWLFHFMFSSRKMINWLGIDEEEARWNMKAGQICFMIAAPGVIVVIIPLAVLASALSLAATIAYCLWWVIRCLCRLGWGTFLAIHSDIRLLCATDSVFGAIIGYYFGNAFLGGVAGVVLGVLNYKLVSIRWLKLVPKTT